MTCGGFCYGNCGHGVICGGSSVNISPEIYIPKDYTQKDRSGISYASGFSLPKLSKAKNVLEQNRVHVVPVYCGDSTRYEKKNFICIGYNLDDNIVQFLDIDNHMNIPFYMNLKETRKLQKSDDCNVYGIRVNSDMEVTIKVKEAIKTMKSADIDKIFDLSMVEQNLRDAKDFLEEEEDYEY